MILDDIAASTRERVEKLKRRRDMPSLRREAETMGANSVFPFLEALKTKELSFICEVKKASPSKGLIAPDFPYLSIAAEYEEAGAAAISVLTEPSYFLGSDRFLEEIAAAVEIPVLRKDFTIDEYQIFEARTIGASAVLLICTLLEETQLMEYIGIAHSLGLSALVEAHTEQEVEMALRAGAGIIGVNNRNLQTFEVDISTSLRLRRMVPEEVAFVSESGIRMPQDVAALRENKTDAVLIGETFMRSPDRKKQLAALRMG